MSIERIDYTAKDLLMFLGQQESQDIRWGDEFGDDVRHHMEHGHEITGAKLPWQKTHELIRFRPGELTIHAGMNGAKKSMILGQMIQYAAFQGEPGAIMSFEMPIKVTIERLIKQAAATPHPSKEFVQRWLDWSKNRLAFYDKLDTTRSDRVLGALLYVVQELGVKHVAIDSLTKCGLPYGEGSAEKDFLDALTATAKATECHVHLVCHVRKPQNPRGKDGNDPVPSKYDVRGAGEITDFADNVIVHWSNRRWDAINRQIGNRGHHAVSPDDLDYWNNSPAQLMVIEKQRHGAFEGKIGLKFHDSLQFHENKAHHLELQP